MAKLRNLKIENEALAGVNVDDAAEISITITSSVTAENNKFTDGAEVTLTANVTAEGNKSLTYAWFKGSEQVGTANPLTITVGNDTKGDYKCKVTVTYDDGNKEKESDVFTIDIAETPTPGPTPSKPTETMVGNRTLSEHLRMRLLGYI
nr:MAG TPA: PKD-like domain [Caudoviricetes sp.]